MFLVLIQPIIKLTSSRYQVTRILLVALWAALSLAQAQTSVIMTPDVSGASLVGQFTSQTIVNGFPAIAYYDASGLNLKYVRATNAEGTSWGSPTVVAATSGVTDGQYPSLVVINGVPMVAYYKSSGKNLMFVSSKDANGAAWNTPITVISANSVGTHACMKEVGGNPAIVCYETPAKDLIFVRATNEAGTTWGTPVRVCPSTAGGQYASLAMVNGSPAVSFYDTGSKNLCYVRATSPIGATWPASPLTLVSAGNTGLYTSMLVVDGNPAVAYQDVSSGDLCYMRANDANGTTWGGEKLLDTAGTVGLYNSLASVDGKPAVSYYDSSNSALKIVRASDTTGTTWDLPVTVDAPGKVGLYTSLNNVAGVAAVSYYDSTNGNLKYALVGTQEIQIEQPAGTILVDGTATLDFGTVDYTAGSATATITVKNISTKDTLNLGVVTLDGANPEDFIVNTSTLPPTLAAGGQATFAVTLVPAAGGPRLAGLHLASNDLDENPFDIALSGTVINVPQTIHFGSIPNKFFGDVPLTISGTATSSLPVTFTLVSGPAELSDTGTGSASLTLTGTGIVTVRATQAGDSYYNAAASVEQSFTVSPTLAANQTITFDILQNRTFGDAPFTISATSTSGLPVSFSVVSGPATLVNSGSGSAEVTLTGAGIVKLRASQVGNASYLAAADVDQSFTVEKSTQSISFAAVADQTFGSAPFSVTATTTSGLATSFSIVSGPADLDPLTNTVSLTGAGLVTIRASQPGNANYLAAANVDRSFTVAKATQLIDFTFLADQLKNAGPITLVNSDNADDLGLSPDADAGSGLPVVFSVSSVPANLATLAVTTDPIGAYPVYTISLRTNTTGTVTVTATQTGNEDYLAATPVSVVFQVLQPAAKPQLITFNPLPDKTFGDPSFIVSATAESGLPVTFSVASGPATLNNSGTGSATVTLTGAGWVTLRASQAGDGLDWLAATPVEQEFNAAGVPQISVEQISGTSLSTIGETVNFGDVLTSTTSSLTFTVKSLGSADLNNVSAMIDGTNASNFLITTAPSSSISAPSGTTTMVVRFTPSKGPKAAVLHISSNDAAKGTYEIALIGYGMTPQMTWRLAQFGIRDNTGIAADNADPDGDQIPNLLEYALGGDPRPGVGAASRPSPTDSISNGTLNLSFPCPRSDLTYVVQGSSNLSLWTTIFSTNGTGASVTVPDTITVTNGLRRFLRLKVTAAP